MSYKLRACISGHHHKWEQFYGRPDEDAYERLADFCVRCGYFRWDLRDWAAPPSQKVAQRESGVGE